MRGYPCDYNKMKCSIFSEVDGAVGHLLLVLLQNGAIILGIGEYAFEFLRGQLALDLDVALLVLRLLILPLLFGLVLLLGLLRLLALRLDLLRELFVAVLDADDALPALRVEVVDGHQHLCEVEVLLLVEIPIALELRVQVLFLVDLVLELLGEVLDFVVELQDVLVHVLLEGC